MPKHMATKHPNISMKKRSRNRERFFKYYDHQFDLNDASFLEHLQKRLAAAMDDAFRTYLYETDDF